MQVMYLNFQQRVRNHTKYLELNNFLKIYKDIILGVKIHTSAIIFPIIKVIIDQKQLMQKIPSSKQFDE